MAPITPHAHDSGVDGREGTAMAVFTIGIARCSCRASRNGTAGRVFGASPRGVINRSDRGGLITALAALGRLATAAKFST